MTQKNSRTSKFRMIVRVTALLLVAVMLITAVPTAIALETVRSTGALIEQTLTLSQEQGVTVTLSGLMPQDGHAEAEPVDMGEDDVLCAYDITIFYPDGTVFEPDEEEPISVSFKSDEIGEAISNQDMELTVTHIADNGDTEEVPLTAAEGNEACFEADSFSIYVIHTHENDKNNQSPRITFHYLSNHYSQYAPAGEEENIGDRIFYEPDLYYFPNKADENVSIQIVKDGECLQPVLMPQNFDWGYFYGWYKVTIDEEKSAAATERAKADAAAHGLPSANIQRYVYEWTGETPEMVDTETPISVAEDQDVYLAPLYTSYRFVSFRDVSVDEGGTGDVVTRKVIALGENDKVSVKISDVKADHTNPSKIFYGWHYVDKDGTVHVYKTRYSTGEEQIRFIEVSRNDVPEGGSLDLYPIFRDAAWVNFASGLDDWGASALEAQFSYLDPSTHTPDDAPQNAEDHIWLTYFPTPTRDGYYFDGWYTGRVENGEIIYDTQVTDVLEDFAAPGSTCSVRFTSGASIVLDDEGSYINGGRLSLKAPITLYAKWRPHLTADYKVVIWKQKVTNGKNDPEAKRTYDYYSYTLMQDQPSGTVILDDPTYIDKGFESLGDSSDDQIKQDFSGFHYSRTIVETNNHNFDGRIPLQRVPKNEKVNVGF